MENRARILEAAARVYAEFGFRGATTRRIAQAAGVNEVTLFRTFGSKAALIEEAVRASAAAGGGVGTPPGVSLPHDPVDPERELTAWAAAQLEHLRGYRALIRKAMGEFEERPTTAPCATEGWAGADRELRDYLERLGEAGFVDWSRLGGPTPGRRRTGRSQAAGAAGGARGPLTLLPPSEDLEAACAMFMAAVFSDAMGRDMRPELYPKPADRAPALYVRLFLRAIACGARPSEARAEPSGAPRRARAGGRPSPDRTST